jgi:hypothetical protein
MLSAIQRLDISGGTTGMGGGEVKGQDRGHDQGHKGQKSHKGQERHLEELIPPNIDDMGAGE